MENVENGLTNEVENTEITEGVEVVNTGNNFALLAVIGTALVISIAGGIMLYRKKHKEAILVKPQLFKKKEENSEIDVDVEIDE